MPLPRKFWFMALPSPRYSKLSLWANALTRVSNCRTCDGNNGVFPRSIGPEQQRCLTQSPPSWSSTTIRTFEPRLGVSCDRSAWKPSCFASISDFLKSDPPDGPTCLVLDVRLPGQSGLDFQRELAAANRELPIIFITGHGDIPMSVQAMKGGAIEFLTKPFRDQDLLDGIQLGLSRDRVRRESEKALADLRERFESLSPREREIMIEVARGRLSKQIAGDIGIAEATVKVHRSRAMRKMNARSLPELGRMADKLKLVSEKPQHS